jgi:hypothetical protein
MERELTPQRNKAQGNDPPPEGSDLDAIRSKLDGILDAADKILDSMPDTDSAEEYLQQTRQRGGQ